MLKVHIEAENASTGLLAFRLKRELQRFDLSEPPPPLDGGGLSAQRPDQQAIDFVRLRRKDLDGES
ncbi:MAG: hypothetical protein OXI12_02460 [Gammaproteobacteria bacterium]|nr:hypothetical protein [Gammaproteobacteria bacterium]MYA79767.1 hypothetical protein [Terriglobia bacterium]